MKTLKTLSAIVFVLLLVSCGKTTEPTPTRTPVGTWTLTNTNNYGCDDSADNFEFACTSSCDVISFGSGLTYIHSDGNSGTYAISGTSGNAVTCTIGSSEYKYLLNSTSTVLTSLTIFPNGCYLDLRFEKI